MRLIEQFRVRGPEGQEHTIACYQDSYDRPSGTGGGVERVDSVRRYCLNGGEDVQRVDDDTFLIASGTVLRRAPARSQPDPLEVQITAGRTDGRDR